jgi:hypothetical protein
MSRSASANDRVAPNQRSSAHVSACLLPVHLRPYIAVHMQLRYRCPLLMNSAYVSFERTHPPKTSQCTCCTPCKSDSGSYIPAAAFPTTRINECHNLTTTRAWGYQLHRTCPAVYHSLARGPVRCAAGPRAHGASLASFSISFVTATHTVNLAQLPDSRSRERNICTCLGTLKHRHGGWQIKVEIQV